MTTFKYNLIVAADDEGVGTVLWLMAASRMGSEQ